MPEGVGYGPQNTASTGLTFNVIGNHAYAYSGPVEDAASGAPDSICLDFRTGTSYIFSHINWLTDYQGGNDTYIDILLNGESIFKGTYDTDPHVVNDQPVRILIPPHSHFQFKWGTTGVTKSMTVVLAGRIYGKIK